MATLGTITVAAPVIPELGFSSKGEPLSTSMTASELRNWSSLSDELLHEEINRHDQPTDCPKDVLLYRLRVYHEPASQFLRFKTLSDLQQAKEAKNSNNPIKQTR